MNKFKLSATMVTIEISAALASAFSVAPGGSAREAAGFNYGREDKKVGEIASIHLTHLMISPIDKIILPDFIEMP